MAHQHHLQRLASPSRSLSLALHLLGIASFAYSFDFLAKFESPISLAYGWHFQFLTIIGLSAALLAFVLGALADLSLSPALFRAKNAVALVATPLEGVVSILYWGIFLVDPALLFPPELRLALEVDLSLHLAPAVFLTLDLVLLSPPWTVSTLGMMSLGTGLAVAYWYWVELCFSKNGWYPYPIFEIASTPQRILLFAVSVGLVTALSVVLKWLYAQVNGSEDVKPQANGLRKKTQ